MGRPWTCHRCGPAEPREIDGTDGPGGGCGACDWTGVDLGRTHAKGVEEGRAIERAWAVERTRRLAGVQASRSTADALDFLAEVLSLGDPNTADLLARRDAQRLREEAEDLPPYPHSTLDPWARAIARGVERARRWLRARADELEGKGG